MSARAWYRHGWTGTEKETEMATDTKKADVKATKEQDAAAARAQAKRESLTMIDSPPPAEPKLTPEEAKKQAEDKKTHNEAIEKVATVNERLAKDGSPERLDVQMRAGEAVYTWGNFVPTRKVSQEDLDALSTVKT